MRLTRRPFGGAADIQRMNALVVAFPHETRHVADLPYKLSSPPLHDDSGHDVVL